MIFSFKKKSVQKISLVLNGITGLIIIVIVIT